MPVEAQTVEYSYTGDGVSTVFQFPSKFLSNSDLVVGLNGVLQLSGYTVAGAESDLGGTVTFTTAPANGVRVLLLRKPPPSQLLDFVNGQSILENTLDNGLDKLTMIAQYLLRGYTRSIKVGDLNTSPAAGALDLPDVVARANKWLRFGATGELDLSTPGPVFAITGGTTFSTRLAATMATVAADVGAFTISGYSAPGDGGAGTYIRLGVAPGVVKPWHISTADGAWWQLVPPRSVTPELFGAKHDGVTSDSAAIQAAVDYCSQVIGSGVVDLGPGIYQITNTISGASGVSLRGKGKRITTIRIPQVQVNGGGLPSHPVLYIRCVGFSVEDLTIQGNRLAWGVVPWTSFSGLYIMGCSYFTVRGVEVRDVESDGIVLVRDSLYGGCNRWSITDCAVDNVTNGINVFKAAFYGNIERNVVTNCDFNPIMIDDATSADVSSATAYPCFHIGVSDNDCVTFGRTGSAAGIVVSGSFDVSVRGNRIRNGGVSGTYACTGIIINSGQDRHNASYNCSVVGNDIDTIYGGGGITLQGCWTTSVLGNNMRALFLWPSVLTGSAINVLDDPGTGTKSTRNNIVSGNTTDYSANLAYGLQLGASTLANTIGDNLFSGQIGPLNVSATAAQGQLKFTGYGALPAWNAGLRGLQWHDYSDDKLKIATSTTWVVVGTQT